MTDSEIRNKILEIFNKVRSTPNASFDEKNFMNYLLDNPRSQNNEIKNSFEGTRKYYDFMGQIELEFCICFTNDDLDGYYNVEKLINKIKERIQKHRGNLMIIKARMEQKYNYLLEIVLTTILLLIAGLFRIHWITFTYTLIYILIITWIISTRIRERKHTKLLYKRITDLK